MHSEKVTCYVNKLFHPEITQTSNTGSTIGQACLIFSNPTWAAACVKFATSSDRGDDVLTSDSISIRVFEIDVRLYVVFFPAPKAPIVQPYWTNNGVGISSRLAEESLKHLDLLREITDDIVSSKLEESDAHGHVRRRLAELMERAPVGPPRNSKVAPHDVYLFQTGMAAIYSVHEYLLSKYNGSTVLFGFAFHSTFHVFEDFGSGGKHFGLGSGEEIDQLETYLLAGFNEGRKVQAVWAEFPSNPLLATPDLARLRKLAGAYSFILIIDETIGSFCNVDVLPYADIVITSLTKSFSGYADVMGGSAILNPSSNTYSELKELFASHYINGLHKADVSVFLSNSNDYLARSKILNDNALALCTYFNSSSQDPNISIASVYYPSLSTSISNYQACMRPKTSEFTPGYGCLFSVEFKSVEAAVAFYDNLNVYQGPHLGAHLTLAMAYVKALYGNELDVVGKLGLKETQIRVSTGLEDTKTLLSTFKEALALADAVQTKEKGV